jgi:phenylacetate-CoA ligase
VIEVQGRRDDTCMLRGRHGHPVALLPLALSTVLEEQAGLFDFQVCQKDARPCNCGCPRWEPRAAPPWPRPQGLAELLRDRQGSVPIRVRG